MGAAQANFLLHKHFWARRFLHKKAYVPEWRHFLFATRLFGSQNSQDYFHEFSRFAQEQAFVILESVKIIT
jgi:hypothetical protein